LPAASGSRVELVNTPQITPNPGLSDLSHQSGREVNVLDFAET